MHMHEGHITVIDADHIEWAWTAYMGGKPDGGHVVEIPASSQHRFVWGPRNDSEPTRL